MREVDLDQYQRAEKAYLTYEETVNGLINAQAEFITRAAEDRGITDAVTTSGWLAHNLDEEILTGAGAKTTAVFMLSLLIDRIARQAAGGAK